MEKGQKLSCVKWLFPRPPTSTWPSEILQAVSCPGDSYIFNFHENRLRGLGAVDGQKSPSPIDLAHGLCNSLYYRTMISPINYHTANSKQ